MNRIIVKDFARKAYNFLYQLFLEERDKKKIQQYIDDKTIDEDGIYYIINCENIPSLGLFGYVEIVLAMTKYALDRDMIPAIDFKNYPNSYLESNEVGNVNAWELFFQQISSRSIEDIYKNHRFVIGNHMDIDWDNRPNFHGYKRRDLGIYWTIMYQKFIKFSEPAGAYCQYEYDKLLRGKEDETLGVLMRGTDINLYKGHAIQPSLQQVEDKIRTILEEDHRFKYLYVATEEKKSEDYIKEKFPGMVITNKRTYYDNLDYHNGLSSINLDGIKTKYDRGMEYLSSMNLLAKCGGWSQDSVGEVSQLSI